MSRPYDFHKRPDDFICMLAAISLLPSRRLEYWDPTLKLYSVSKDVYHFSFKVRKSEDVYGRKWLLLLVDDRKGEAESQEYWFVLHKPLLVHTAEAVNARTVQTYMRFIKSSWQPVSKIMGNHEPLEAYIYEQIPDFNNRLFAASVVKGSHGLKTLDVDGNRLVLTLGFIREGVDVDTEATKEENGIILELARKSKSYTLEELKESLVYLAFKPTSPRKLSFLQRTLPR